MGCNNTNVKDEIPNKIDEENQNDKNDKNNNINKNENDNEEEEDENSNNSNKKKKNQDEESSRLDDDDDDDDNDEYKIKKFDPNHLLSEESKGILNLYNGKVYTPQICIVPDNKVFEPKGPEDKKPPDINKLREKKKIKNVTKKRK